MMTNREHLKIFFATDNDYIKLHTHELYNLMRNLHPDDVISLMEHRQLIELIAGLRQIIEDNDRLHGENFNSTLESLLSVGEDGLYSDPLRFLFELIQDVDDADYDDLSNVKLSITFQGNNIQLVYNERGFSPFNVFAITGVAEAAKNIDDSKVEIGEKGLGFKSVFGIAESVLIQSGLFSFRLDKKHFTIPIPEYYNYSPVKGTRLTLTLKSSDEVERICRLIKERYCKTNAIFQQNPMLFLNKLTELELLVDNASKQLLFIAERKEKHTVNDHLSVERGVTISASLKSFSVEKAEGDFRESIIGDRYTYATTYTRSMCKARYGANTKLTKKLMTLQVIFPHKEYLGLSKAIEAGALYSFLPTQVSATQSWVKDESNYVKHNSECKMPPYDFDIEVRWKAVEQAEYTVVYWVQSLNDKYDTPNENKTYDFLKSEPYMGNVGQKPRINKVLPQNNGLNETFYEVNKYRSDLEGIKEGGRGNYYADAKKTIAPDGSTVINVYFDRKTVTLEFGHYEGKRNNRKWFVDHKRVGLYGQNWREAGYGTNGWPGGRWSDEEGLGEGNWTYLDGFNHEDLTSISVRLVENSSDGRKDIYQYIEALDSTPENRKWIEADHYENGSGSFTLTSKFLPGFTLYGYNTSTSNPTGSKIDEAPSGESVSYSSRLNVFSTRNSFELSYANCKGMPSTTYKYEAVLNEPVGADGNPIVPTRPDNVEPDNVFAGWYLDSAGQVPVSWGKQTMPAANMVVYAKWVRPTFTVTYHDIRIDTLGNNIDVDTYQFEVEKFGSLVTSCGEEFATFEKSYVRDNTKWTGADGLEYVFRGWYLDENHTVSWEPSTTISGDKDVYAYWVPKGTVHYRYAFIGIDGQGNVELGKWPYSISGENVWLEGQYGATVEAEDDFLAADMDGFPKFEGWRPMSTLNTTSEKLTKQYQEIPIYYTPTSTWPVTIHYVDDNGAEILGADGKPLTEEHDLTEAIKVYDYKRIPNYKLVSDAQQTARKDMERGEDGRVHIYFRYVKINPLPYTVEYYQEQLDGTYARVDKETVTYNAEQSGLKLGETAKIQEKDYKTFEGFIRNDDHEDAKTSVILQKVATNNVLRLYYARREYTVTYVYGNAKPEGAPDVPAQQTYKYGAEVTVADRPTCAGYEFNGWYSFTDNPVSGTYQMPARNVVLQGNWAADTDTAYQVWFYFEGDDGTYPTDDELPEGNKVRRSGVTDTEVSVTDADKSDKNPGGLWYRFDADNANNNLKGTVTADGSLVLKLYFERVMANYTVHHYLKDTTTPIAADDTGSAQVGSSVKASAAESYLYEGLSGVVAESAVPTNAKITVSEDTAKNVITIYYTLPLTLRANSASKTYDGKALKNGGFTVVNSGNLMGYKDTDITLSMTADSVITLPGTEPNEIDENSVKIDGKDLPTYYELKLEEGELTVYNRLNVSKTITTPGTAVAGEKGPALDVPTFKFKLTKDGQAVSSASYTVGSSTYTTGNDGSFSLEQGQTATFTGLAPGSYTVREVVNDKSAWYPYSSSGGDMTVRGATIGTSDNGDISVSFNNYRRNVNIKLSKTWVDGKGTAANRPDELTLKLVGKVGDDEVYRADVTLTQADNWRLNVNGLPAYYNGSAITYSLAEEVVPAGYGEPNYGSGDKGLTVTNTVKHEQRTITGKKTWVDGGKTHDNANDITLTLWRRTKGTNSSWTVISPGQGDFTWIDTDTYQFTNLPSHDTEGYEYEYRVVETTNVPNVKYDIAYTGAEGKDIKVGDGGIAEFVNATATVNITNTVLDENDFYLYGYKIWNDGGKEHDNASELTLTLWRKSSKPGSAWEVVSREKDIGGYGFGWTQDKPNQYGFNLLERYDDEGYYYLYKVEETINDKADAKLYETKYSIDSVNSNNNGRQINITNTLKQEYLTIKGTKTWVDGGKEHDNAKEVELTLTRKSAEQNAQSENVDATPVWKDNTYTYTGLDRYDAEGYEYTYEVKEAGIDGYTTSYEENTFNITNTLIDPNDVEITGTKTWVDGGRQHDNANDVTLTLTRKSAEQNAQSENVDATPVWKDNTYTYSGLDRYDAEGYEYTYEVKEAGIDGYTTSYEENTFNITNTLKQEYLTIKVTKTWVDGGENHGQIQVNVERKVSSDEWSGFEGSSITVDASTNWQYTFTNLPKYDENRNAYTYRVSEVVPAGYDVSYSDADGKPVADGIVFDQNNTATVNITNTLKTNEVTVYKYWEDTFNGSANYYGLRPDDVTVKFVSQPQFEGADTYTYEVKGDMWKSKDTSTWQATLVMRTHDEMGNALTYTVEELSVQHYTRNEDYPLSINPSEQNIAQVYNELDVQDILVEKVWDDAGWEDIRPEISFKLSNTDEELNFEPITLRYDESMAFTVFGSVPASDSYVVEEIINTAGMQHSYTTSIVKSMEAPSAEPTEVPTEASSAEPTSEDGKTFTVTNKLNLQGGDGKLTVNKTWDDMWGSASDRPEVSFQLLYNDGTPVTVGEDNEPYIVELGEDGKAVFENLPAHADGYIVKELIDEDTNKWGYAPMDDVYQKAVTGDANESAVVNFHNIRTIAEITVTKKMVDDTIYSEAGMASKFVFGVTVLNDDGTPADVEQKSKPIGNGESATFNVPVGAKFVLKEYDASGNAVDANVWQAQGLGEHRFSSATGSLDVTNTRAMYNGGGDITVSKSWLDGKGDPLADELIPESVEVQLYVEDTPILDSTALSGADEWKHTYEDMPAAFTDGTPLDYEVKEIVDGTAYGDGDTVTIGEYDYEVSIDGFTITNTLKRRNPTEPEKTADDESKDGVQVGDTITYTISRTSHLNTPATATVTDALPRGLEYVGTTSVKVNGTDATYDLAQDGSDIKWTIGNVPPMGEVEVVFTARVTEAALEGSDIRNKAEVKLGDEDDTAFESDDEALPIANFTLEKTAALPDGKTKAEAGDTIEYTVVIKNTHTVPINSVIIEDNMFGRIDGDVEVVGGESLKVIDGKITISQSLGQDESLTIKYRVVVTDEDVKLGYMGNVATVTATTDGDDKIVREDDTHTEVEEPEPPTPTTPAEGHITVTKRTVSAPKDETGYALGETIEYLITVVNDGNLTITDIDVLDSLSDAEGRVIGRIDSLEPGESRELSFEYTVKASDILRGKVVNEATVKGTSPDPDTPDVPVTPGETEDKTTPEGKPKDDEPEDNESRDDDPNVDVTFSIGAGYSAMNVFDCCE